MRSKIVLSSLCAALAVPALAAPSSAEVKTPPPGAAQPAARCEHGVKNALCTRCNPKLAAVYKAKGDWCAEHERPETQCVLCHPALAKEGVK
jgi:hypothetical protein